VEKKVRSSPLLGMIERDHSKSTYIQHPLILAYLGDAVYELYVRYHLVARGIVRPQTLQKEAIRYVSAVAQANLYRQLESSLSEEEKDLVKRGRNAKSGRSPKNTKVSDYRYSTGLEALIGYLYLSGDQQRLTQLMQSMFKWIDEGEKAIE
jgi:ribonuclease-3 family protein